VYIAPSGVQKERIEPSHIFVLPYPQAEPSPHTDRIFLRRPKLNLKESACTPLFWNAFTIRNAGSCIHTHSQNAVMATLLWEKEKMFRISHQVSRLVCCERSILILFAGGIELLLSIVPSLISGKMIKGVRIGGNGRTLSYLDTLEVPIIDNTPNEEDLKDSMKEAMEKYPSAAGILVLRHGIYVWGMSSASHHGFYVLNSFIRRRLAESENSNRGRSRRASNSGQSLNYISVSITCWK
jgi:methylthioribulose-1-phosphate dehydratase